MSFLLWIVALVMIVLLAALLTAIMRRTLGARIAWVRTFVVALAALLVGVPIAGRLASSAHVADRDGHLLTSSGVAVALVVVMCLWVFAAALAAMMLLEILLPSGAVPGPRGMYAALRDAFRRSMRYLRILRAVGGSGLGGALRRGPSSPEFGPALTRALNRSGVTFVKLGQILATRDDILPRETTGALARLQTDAAPEDVDAVRATIEAELGASADDVFSAFDAEPLAAASVGQVHAARTIEGDDVVVKVQRAHARAQVRVDADILMRLAGTAEARLPWARGMGVGRLAAGLVRSLEQELDYRIEAASTEALAAALEDRADVVVPAVRPELSTSRVLVLERLAGTPLSAGEAALSGLTDVRRTELADALVGSLLETLFVRGVFHADLHPGNIMVLDDGRIGLLDFGAVGVLDSETRGLLALMLFAILGDDAIGAVDALLLAFDTPDDVDVPALRRDLGRQIALIQLQSRIGPDTFAQLFAILREHAVGVPGDVAAAFRTLASVEGALAALDPERTLLGAAREQLPGLMLRIVSPERLAVQTATQAGVATAVARRLPERVEQISTALADGSFTVRTRAFADEADRHWVREQANNVMAAAFGIAACVLAVVLLTREDGPMVTDTVSLWALLGSVLGFCGVTLALRVMVRLYYTRD